MSKHSESDPIALEQRVIRLVHANLLKLPAKRRGPALDYLRQLIESSVAGPQLGTPTTEPKLFA